MTPRVDADADVDARDDVDVALNARAPNPAWTKAPWASISTSNRPRSTRGFERRPPRASDADVRDEDRVRRRQDAAEEFSLRQGGEPPAVPLHLVVGGPAPAAQESSALAHVNRAG